MKIYLDLVFIVNFLFDLILLFAVGLLLRRKTNLKRLFLGALVGAMTIFVLFIEIDSLSLFFFKIFISILMVGVGFGFKNVRYTIQNMLYLYTTSILLGGFLYLLNDSFSYKNTGLVFYHNGFSLNIILLLILSPLAIYFYVKQIKQLKNNYSNYYNVDIYFKDGTKKEVVGFVDTGNKLKDPYQNRPIILMNKKDITFDYTSSNILLVPYDTASSHSLMKCIIPEKVFILGVGFRKKVLIGLIEENIKIDGVNCILHSDLLEGMIR